MLDRWTGVDRYITDLFVPSDAALDDALSNSEREGLPPHNVAPNQGKLLFLLAQIRCAQTILELGTLGGYSTIWFARAVGENGRVISLESNAHHAAIARSNIANAGLLDRVEIRVGSALESLHRLHQEGRAPFDMVFIDADKQNNAEYLEWALRLTARGSVIIADNVVRGGAVLDAASTDASVVGTRRFMEMLASERRLSSTAIQTVGSKGYDGFAIALVVG